MNPDPDPHGRDDDSNLSESPTGSATTEAEQVTDANLTAVDAVIARIDKDDEETP